MTAKTGADTIIGFTMSSIWGTAVECGAGDKMPVESFAWSNNTSELMANDIGDGNDMVSSVEPGTTNPTLSITEKMFYDGPSIERLALLFGADSASVSGDGDLHQITYDPDRADLYGTVAWENTAADAAEMETGLPTGATITIAPNDYMRQSMEYLGNDIVIEPDETTVNTVATLANCTLADVNRIVVRPDDGLWINAQSGGALSSADCEPITDMTVTFTRALEIVQEVRCEAGNGVPRSTGDMPFVAEIVVNFRSLDKMDYFNAVKAGEEFKAQFTVTGPLIGGSTYRTFKLFFPRLKVVVDPTGDKTNTTENPYSVTFKALVASANPTGMSDTYPYVEVVNDRTAAYLTV